MAASEEFQEDEVWSAVKEVSTKSSTSSKASNTSNNVNVVVQRVSHQSAPVNIPYHLTKVNGDVVNKNEDDDDDDDEDEDSEKVPPHEWLAKKLARSQISSFSVCEGAGRTLKGRDLSRVRNAVLTRTGFLE
ncbi:Senescence regulator S40 protein [Dioscorea alata]|uniref:Senescence regulator S40 protein n=1 Tax=Dioscorea alata TaxID=55571 RepID=A0ACB7VN16_DIOAL|nr:Senescence regulator S40 protein [Dioscorea alata]